MGKKYNFDYVVIGSGPAGTTAALTLARKAKNKVAIVEDHAFGGNNLNSRDVPYLVSLGFSHTFSKLANYPEINAQEMHFNFPSVVMHQNQTIQALGGGSTDVFDTAGIISMFGHAHFIDAHTLAVGHEQITSEYFIIATGAKLNTGDIVGLDDVPCLTPETAIKLRKLPKYALVVGGGSTGCEIASYFAELGTSVFMAEASERILPKEDPEASNAVMDYFTTKLGIKIATETKVVAVERDAVSKKVILSSNGREKSVRIDCIIRATGSKPVLDIGLENAEVKYSENGIQVNKMFQTTTKNIYAIGDALGGDSSTERAVYQGKTLALNLLDKARVYPDYRGFVRVTSTNPEVAAIGKTEAELKKEGIKFRKAVVYIKDLPISKIDRFSDGLVKMIIGGNRRILGATIVAPNASLMASEISLAVRHNMTIDQLRETPHIANSFAAVIGEISDSL